MANRRLRYDFKIILNRVLNLYCHLKLSHSSVKKYKFCINSKVVKTKFNIYFHIIYLTCKFCFFCHFYLLSNNIFFFYFFVINPEMSQTLNIHCFSIYDEYLKKFAKCFFETPINLGM